MKSKFYAQNKYTAGNPFRLTEFKSFSLRFIAVGVSFFVGFPYLCTPIKWTGNRTS